MTYAPRPGSNVDRVMQVLAEHGPMARVAVAKACNMDAKYLSGNLATAISEGLIIRTIVDGKNGLALGPGAPRPIGAPVADAPASPRPVREFSAALWSDGTMALLNCETAAGDFTSIELTADQVERVRALLSGFPNG